MSHVLITFLGKNKKDGDIYPTERYHFEDDDTEYYETSFFGLAVLEHLAQKNRQPDKLVVLGTSGSMWDAFFQLSDDLDAYEDDYYDLAEIIENNSQYQEQSDVTSYLKTAETILKEHLKGKIDCELRLIPYGEKQDDQILILKEMAACVGEKDTVSLDITHGLRHLPMLTVLSAMYLEVVKKVTINGIYYGAQDIKHLHNDVVEAVNLGGLLQIAKWVGKLTSFENNGDYSVFTDVLKDDGFAEAELLKKAAYFERSINLSGATNTLQSISDSIGNGLPGIGNLFSKTLEKKVAWHKLGNGLDNISQAYAQQRQLAFSYLKKRDYVRAAIFALEGVITRFMKEGEDPYLYEDRQIVTDERRVPALNCRDFFFLKDIRNQLAHGTFSRNEDVVELLQNEQRFYIKLEELLNNLLPRNR